MLINGYIKQSNDIVKITTVPTYKFYFKYI